MHRPRNFTFLLSLLLILGEPIITLFAADSSAWRQLIEADWLAYEESLLATNRTAVLPADDAAGGCDGIKDGGPGFHTDRQAQPWWQVDLGKRQAICRIVVWNRTECADRAARLLLQLSDDGRAWQTVYQHNGRTFGGTSDQKPLRVQLTNQTARFVRVQLPSTDFLHLDEVEVFGTTSPAKNLALHRPANQSSLSQWSKGHYRSEAEAVDWPRRTQAVLGFCARLLAESSVSSSEHAALNDQLVALQTIPGTHWGQTEFLRARWLQRRIGLANPLLNFDSILVTKRVPGSFNHMSDQYYGWWSRPGGGIYLLKNFKSEEPTLVSLTDTFREPGSFLRPALSYDARKVLFAWCRYYPHLAAETNKLDKANVPEDAFYHLFEMNIDGTAVRQIPAKP